MVYLWRSVSGSSLNSHPSSAAAAAKSRQSCPTLCDPINGSPPGSPVPGILQERILDWVAMLSSRGSSQPRGSNLGLPHCRQILYQLSHKGNPRILEWVACPFSSRSSNQELNLGLLHCRQILYQLSYQGSSLRNWSKTW